MPALLFLALLTSPQVEVREFDINAGLGNGGRWKLTRTVDLETKTLTTKAETFWAGGDKKIETSVFDASGMATSVETVEIEGKKTRTSWVKVEGEKIALRWDAPSGGPVDKWLVLDAKAMADPSRWWFVTETPKVGDVLESKSVDNAFGFQKVKVTYRGLKTIKVNGKDTEVRAVERTTGNNSPRIEVFLDEKGMPVAFDWYSGGSTWPHRVDTLRKGS